MISVILCVFLKLLKMFFLSLSDCNFKNKVSSDQVKALKVFTQGTTPYVKSPFLKYFMFVSGKLNYLLIELNLFIHYVNFISPSVEAITCWQSMPRQRFISAGHYDIFDRCGSYFTWLFFLREGFSQLLSYRCCLLFWYIRFKLKAYSAIRKLFWSG